MKASTKIVSSPAAGDGDTRAGAGAGGGMSTTGKFGINTICELSATKSAERMIFMRLNCDIDRTLNTLLAAAGGGGVNMNVALPSTRSAVWVAVSGTAWAALMIVNGRPSAATILAGGTLAEGRGCGQEHALDCPPDEVGPLPVHRDLAGFDFGAPQVDEALVGRLADLTFIEHAQNLVLIGGPGTGKTHLATALGISGLTRHGRRVRFYSTVDQVNALEQEKAQRKAGRIALSLLRMDLVILDELGYLPFSQAGVALLFHLLSKLSKLSKLYEHTSVMITTNFTFAQWSSVLGDAGMTTALLDRLTHHCHIVESGNESYRFRHSAKEAKGRIKGREQARKTAKAEPPVNEPF